MSIRKREWINPKGKECKCWIVDYVNAYGKRVRKGGFKTRPEAKAFEASIVTAVNKGFNTEIDKIITFDDAAMQYIEYDTKLHCKPSTIDAYEGYLRAHLKPYFTGMRLVNITPQTVREFIKHQKDTTKLSNNSIDKNVRLLKSIIQKQVDEGALFLNPVDKVKKLKIETKEMRALNVDEVMKILETCKKHNPDFYPILFTALFTGMRRGELLALTWDKINWVKCEIKIDRSIYKGQFVTPKTKTSIRKIGMTQELVKVLKEWKLKSLSNSNNFVFANEAGNSIDPRNLVQRMFVPIVKRAGIDKLRWHDLRHTYASILMAKNAQIKFIQKQLGHSSAKMTIDRYGHLLQETYDQGLRAFDDLFIDKGANELKMAN